MRYWAESVTRRGCEACEAGSGQSMRAVMGTKANPKLLVVGSEYFRVRYRNTALHGSRARDEPDRDGGTLEARAGGKRPGESGSGDYLMIDPSIFGPLVFGRLSGDNE